MFIYSSRAANGTQSSILSSENPEFSKKVLQVALPAFAGVALFALAASSIVLFNPFVIPILGLGLFAVALWRFKKLSDPKQQQQQQLLQQQQQIRDLQGISASVATIDCWSSTHLPPPPP